MRKPCKWCGSTEHTQFYCPKKPRTPIKNHSKPISRSLKPNVSKKSSTKHKSSTRSRSVVKKELMKLVKDYIKKRDNYTCQYCGKKVSGCNCQASHVLPVGSHANMQFDPLNMKVLCYHHHLNWWHKNPLEAADWFKTKFPERWEYLKEQDKKHIKLSTSELEDLIKHYKELK